MSDVIESVMPEYSKELDEKSERVVTNVIAVLNNKKVEDELIRARVLSKHKAFIRDIFNASVEAGLY